MTKTSKQEKNKKLRRSRAQTLSLDAHSIDPRGITLLLEIEKQRYADAARLALASGERADHRFWW
jgi:hypothetical protein